MARRFTGDGPDGIDEAGFARAMGEPPVKRPVRRPREGPDAAVSGATATSSRATSPPSDLAAMCAELERLLAEAMPDRWEAGETLGDRWGVFTPHRDRYTGGRPECMCHGAREENAALMAAAVNALRPLLAAVREVPRLRAIEAAARAVLAHEGGEWGALELAVRSPPLDARG